MHRKLIGMIAVASMALGVLTAACSSDDSNPANPETDGGTSSSGGSSSGQTSSSGGSSSGGTGDAGDAGCTFAGYVIDQIQNHTNATGQPDPTLGDPCTPSTSQADFMSLFP